MLSDLGSGLWVQFTGLNWVVIVQAVLLLVVGLFAARLAARGVERLISGRLDVHQATVFRRLVFYVLVGLVVATALHQLGFRLGVLLGAAGILTVAIGFASQTSASNLISGLFLLAERPFQIGDTVKVADVTGEVLAVDLLSVKLRTFDNLFVRIPNETMMKSLVTNFSRFPIRRYDLQLGVAYGEDMARVQKLIEAVADRNPLCLVEPKPQVIFQGFGSSSVDVQVSVWARRENFLALRTSLPLEIKGAFDDEDIEIPFPHVSLYAGKHSGPLPVRHDAADQSAKQQQGEFE